MLRKKWMVVLAVLAALLAGRAHAQYFGNNIPGTSLTVGEAIGIVAGSAAAITVVTIVLVHNAHPTLKGCVTAGSGGMLLQNEGDQKTYALSGISVGVRAGDVVKVKGKKNKHQKDSAGREGFVVQSAGKDYGPCKTAMASASP